MNAAGGRGDQARRLRRGHAPEAIATLRVSALDPLTHLAVALALFAAAALASYLSARRASALDPALVLRGD